MLKGIRGAITVESNTREDILDQTEVLLREIQRRNDLDLLRIASAIFTLTPDLNAEFPAVAARRIGWTDVALMCAKEVDVPHALPMCIRVLIHYNCQSDDAVSHVYLGGAVSLRKDLLLKDEPTS